MPYTALYRKLRSQKFSDMVGQEHIVRTLKNQIKSSRISHAYLFCGIRGTGKTTAARIFSRAVNCQAPENGEPCNQCATCLDILKERSLNVSEIDAASNNGVENIRDLIEECYYPPTSGKYKIYIIDEVHMLSASAFNALLKTLEEPPEHVAFILATTDPQKIPATIHSRCQRFDFKRIRTSDITGHLRKCAELENVDITDEALNYIASVSDGAMRDALKILEQCVSFYFDETITLEKVLDLLGAVDSCVFFELTDAICAADSIKCMQIIDEAVINGRDISQFISGCLIHFRNILVSASSDVSVVDASEDNIIKLRAQGKKIDGNILIHYINTFAELQGKLKFMPNERAMLEVACIKLCSPSASDNYDALFSRIKLLERYIEEGKLVVAAESQTQRRASTQENQEKSETKKQLKPKAVEHKPETVKQIEEGWQDFISVFELLDREILLKSSVEYNSGGLNIVCADKISADLLRKKEDVIVKRLSETFGADFSVIFTWQKKSKVLDAPPPDDDLWAQANGFINYDIEYE